MRFVFAIATYREIGTMRESSEQGQRMTILKAPTFLPGTFSDEKQPTLVRWLLSARDFMVSKFLARVGNQTSYQFWDRKLGFAESPVAEDARYRSEFLRLCFFCSRASLPTRPATRGLPMVLSNESFSPTGQ